jgi:amino acid transporter
VQAPEAVGTGTRFQARAGLLAIIGLLYASACGGPYGVENFVSKTGPGLFVLLLFVTPWLWGVPMALATAELATLRPVEGGYYRWVREILGEFWGFQAGASTLIASFLDNALYPVLFSKSLRHWYPDLSANQQWLAAVAFIAILTYLNYLGIQIAGGAAVALNLLLIAPLAWIALAGFARARFNPLIPFTPPGVSPWAGFGGGLALAMWFYSGYAEMSTAAEEMRDPARNIPRALLIVTPFVVLSYVAPFLASLAAVGGWTGWQSGHFMVIGEALGGAALARWVFLGSVASQTVIFMAYLLWYSRICWALAADGWLPSFFARLHPRRGTPDRVLLAYAVIYSILARIDFEDLLVADIWVTGAYHLLLLASLVRARTTLPDRPPGFRVPGGSPGAWVNFLVPAATWVVVLGTTARGHIRLCATALLLPPALYVAERLIARRPQAGRSDRSRLP